MGAVLRAPALKQCGSGKRGRMLRVAGSAGARVCRLGDPDSLRGCLPRARRVGDTGPREDGGHDEGRTRHHTGLERIDTRFASPDAHHVHQLGDENLAVPDLAGIRGLRDRFDDFVHLVVRHGDFQF